MVTYAHRFEPHLENYTSFMLQTQNKLFFVEMQGVSIGKSNKNLSPMR